MATQHRGTGSKSGAGIIGSSKRSPTGPGPEVMSADTLEGNDVYNSQGEKLGEVEEIMLDVPSGRVAYAVMESGGLMGVGTRLYAIPWGALTLDTDRKCFVLDIDKEQLKLEPGFDKNDWPSMADERWARDLHERFRTPPYWG